jgi:Flp pilus assembly protein TadG
MIRRFREDLRGNFAMITVAAMLPIMGGVALAVDYAEMTRERQLVENALDAAAIATARHVVDGATDAELIAYATDFFHANLGSVSPADTTLTVTLPTTANGGGTLKLGAVLDYKPYFLPVFREMLNGATGSNDIRLAAGTEVRLKNTLEVALVLDNSGSMSDPGKGSGEDRIDLL